MLNSIVVMGRLTRDPELRRTGSGIPVASFTLAVDRDYSPKDGGEKETDFIDCTAWRSAAEFISKYFTKGRMMVVQGRLEIRNWTDKDGNKRRSAEINVENAYFGDSKKPEDQNNGGYSTNGGYDPNGGGYGNPNGGGYGNPNGGGYGNPNGGGYGNPNGGGYGNPNGGGYGNPNGSVAAPTQGGNGYNGNNGPF